MKAMKIKNILRCLGLLLTALFLPSCGQTMDTPEASTPEESSYLKLEIELPATRGYEDKTSFVDGDEVLLWVIFYPYESYSYPKTYKATYNEGNWHFETPVVFDKTIRAFSVDVCYPYDKFIKCYGFDSGHSFSCDLDNVTDQTDLLYGNSKYQSTSEPSIKVTLDHIKTRLTFDINSSSNGEISNIIVSSFTDQISPYYFSPVPWIVQSVYEWRSDFKWTYEFLDSETTINLNDKISLNSTGTSSINVLMMPTNEYMLRRLDEYRSFLNQHQAVGESGLLLSFDLDGKPVSVKIPGQDWQHGQQYVYPINIKKNGATGEVYVILDDAQITPWYESTVTDTEIDIN